MSILSYISDIPLRVRLYFSGNKEQHQTFEEFCCAQSEKPKKLVLIKAKDRLFLYDDVLVRLKGVPRYYPENDDYSNPLKNENEKEEPFSIVKPDIKIVGKIEPVELELLKQKENQIKLSNEQLKEQAQAARKQAEEQAKAARVKAKERAKVARKLEKEQAKAVKIAKKRAEKQLQDPEKIVIPKKKSKKGKVIVEKVQAQEVVQSENTIIIDDAVTKNERQIELEYPLEVAPVKPDETKYYVDDVLVKMRHVRRFYPKDYDKTKQPVNSEHIEDTGLILKPDIKVVDKIDLVSLNQSTRPVKKSKKQLERDRKSAP